MTSLKPYLIRAIYDWIVDNDLTPYLLANAESQGVVVPQGYVQDGKIILNIRPEAVQQLSLGNQLIEFSARFGGMPRQLSIPVRAVLAVYAKENGKGMIFDEDDEGSTPPSGSAEPSGKTSKRPALKVVK